MRCDECRFWDPEEPKIDPEQEDYEGRHNRSCFWHPLTILGTVQNSVAILPATSPGHWCGDGEREVRASLAEGDFLKLHEHVEVSPHDIAP